MPSIRTDRAQFRKAMKALGVEGGREHHDELFDMWDVVGPKPPTAQTAQQQQPSHIVG